MVLEEFIELLARIAVAQPDCYLKVMIGDDSGLKKTWSRARLEDQIESWIVSVFLQAAGRPGVMPRTVHKEFNAAAKADISEFMVAAETPLHVSVHK